MSFKTFIGTSGWNYDHWKGKFYPKDLKQKEWFYYYAKHFRTVEINNTFYQLPEKKTFENWHDQAPKDFSYSVKANRYITHMKNLKDIDEPLKNFYSHYENLKESGGPILFQLPPQWNLDFERLENFVGQIKGGHPDYRHSVEFRNNSWYEEKVFNLLEENNIALCIHDHKDGPSPEKITADFLYMRFHGTNGLYKGKYPKEDLQKTAGFIKKLDLDAYCYFNNDFKAFAMENAKELKEILEGG